MDNDTIYQKGYVHGQDLVSYNYPDVKITKNMDYENYIDAIYTLVWQADDNYRSYSPFEFFAHALNSMEDPDNAWEVYGNGLTDGVETRINTLVNEEWFENWKKELFDE
jgi:hypothetical protein